MRYIKKYQKPMIVVYPIVTEDDVAYNFPTSMDMPMNNAKESSTGFNDGECSNVHSFDIANDNDE